MKPRQEEMRQILGRVKRDEFIGRAAELEQLVTHAARSDGARGLLILLAPLAGVSELLRQTYDELFRRQGNVIPIYYALPQTENTAVSAAIEFLNTFLLQYIAYRRAEPSLCQASLTLDDLVQLAPAADLPWIEELVEAYNRQRFGDDDRELVRFCLTAPRRVRENDDQLFVLFDAVQLASYADPHLPLATELFRALRFVDAPFALAGLRREILDAVERAGGNTDSLDIMRLDSLETKEARDLVTSAAHRQQVAINDETRDLLVQQLDGSPFCISSMLNAAREKHLSLDSYLSCERLYVDELLGGRLNRYFSSFLERVAPVLETRRGLVRLLCESVTSGRGNRTAPLEVWRKRLFLESGEVEQVLRRLHIHELVNWDGETVDTEGAPTPWRDYLRSRFRLDALREPRALVVADMMAHALKRAPQTIALHYRRAASLRLRELIGKFNSQRVPKVLFDFARFADVYRGLTAEEIVAGLDAEIELLRLPQVFHTASGVSFGPQLREFGEESSVVAHAFEGATYTDANEIVWLVAKIDSKLEANRKETETWLSLLEALASKSAFVRTQIWLIANEGFSSEAIDLIREHGAYGSSQQQFEVLSARLSEMEGSIQQAEEGNEIVMIMPMGGDYEMLSAMTAEQLARRLNFRPEAINQIKTAIVEACINASEHSLSPDRKIYQRFRVEDDKLVITIASRGIVPSNVGNTEEVEQILEDESGDAAEQRRGWGLKLIKTLMDEVEFERVDEGTSLRMSKHLRS
ncbi:MAG: ATP-binding protein [Acidobacteriota bacterium]|nr:ATP-binding protein [Acidobacteriota bacterium]